MADMRIFPQVKNPPRRTADDGAPIGWRGTRDGAAFVADYKLAQIMDGRGFHVSVGAFTTPVAGGGATAPVAQPRPRFAISVPANTIILPIRVHVVCQIPLAVTDSDESEIILAVDKTVASIAGTSTAKTPVNMLTNHIRASAVTVSSVHTADLATVPVLDIELAHAVKIGDIQGTAANAMWNDLSLLYEPLTPVIIAGPATLLGYWGGTVATTGFAAIQWVEIPLTDVS